jgi:hypothetical protein
MNDIEELTRQRRELDEKLAELKAKSKDPAPILAEIKKHKWKMWADTLEATDYFYDKTQKIFNSYFKGIKRRGFIELDDTVKLERSGCIRLINEDMEYSNDTAGFRRRRIAILNKLLAFTRKHGIKVSTVTHKEMIAHHKENIKDLEEEIAIIEGQQ